MTGFSRIAAILLGLPLAAAAEEHCPWLNAATAAGFLGGAVQASVTASSCEFVLRIGAQETTLRIEVAAAGAPHGRCEQAAERLTGIGNEAAACSVSGKPGWTAEQVAGRVRDQAFLVRISTNDRAVQAKTLRQKVRDIAEQVAGILF